MSGHYRSVIIITIILAVSSCAQSGKDEGIPYGQVTELSFTPADTAAVTSPVLLCGIPADSFNVIRGKIRQNRFLSQILAEYGIGVQEIEELVRNSSDVFDVRKIRAGNNYFILCDNDSAGKAKYMIYEHDPALSYIFSFNDSLNITPFSKEITRKIKYSSGTVETSLWEAMVAGDLNPLLAISLSEIFAWTVDFFGLQKGDHFKVIYEELFIDDDPQGIGRIFGAQFTWGGKTTNAIPFVQNGVESYYDSEGNSLRKAFLKAPLRFTRISSRFSPSRLHPILRIRRPHFGVDYAAPAGTPVHAVGDGRVVSAITEGASGKMVKIVHNSVYSTAYLHLSRFGPGIAAGRYVKQGDIIGYVGSTGLSTGPHLDFRFYKNGSPVDPLKVEAPPTEPVLSENMESFEIARTVMESLLESI
ncbi:MAG TPA: peptidoglycan DD-metalloendopeptidase family protein [Bacteroidales bacterium]|jgi:murein DD-endopeptidase MepM/ murein hydrolase activator NlpD|nr:peptidoglycan DD-metalloendopeptidase family protein [Bacteroidales bacterium]HOS72601.1 peptidoglycan DD-metalloendopeptidase family protein [Bacteroidales bacterium]HQH25194.1 peptidoglycan DD-metalloendopeptidase family protein [Bacteroidales bacterium]HQK70091.1 peptidoglycan DD-metalloendopeptidase family protein [Bacteroidales bacterium]